MSRSTLTRSLPGWRALASLLALALCGVLLTAARGTDAGTGAPAAAATVTAVVAAGH